MVWSACSNPSKAPIPCYGIHTTTKEKVRAIDGQVLIKEPGLITTYKSLSCEMETVRVPQCDVAAALMVRPALLCHHH